MSTTSTLAYENEFQPARIPRSAEVNANFAAIAELINTTGLATNNFKAGTFTAAKLESNVATTAKIADLNVTRPKLESLNIVFGSNQASFNSGLGSTVDVTGSEITITTTGRNIIYGLIPASDGSVSQLTGGQGGGSVIRVLRNGVAAHQAVRLNSPTSTRPISSIWTFIDVSGLGAGTYTFSLSATAVFTQISLSNYRAFAYEVL